jgi:hypothetical protein
LSQKELLEQALKAIAKLKKRPEPKPAEPLISNAPAPPATPLLTGQSPLPSEKTSTPGEAKILEQLAPEIEEFKKFFNVTGIRVIRKGQERGISMEKWRMQEIARQTDAYLRSLSQHQPRPAIPGKIPQGVHKRKGGETVLFAGYEWIYAPNGITRSTWEQLEQLAAQGESIVVIRWSRNPELIFDTRQDNAKSKT